MSENDEKNILNATVEGKDLVMKRKFNAPRDLVFKAFSEPGILTNWWGPEGWQTKIHRFEFKPDGEWLYSMKCTDETQGDFYGQESWGKAVYQEISKPEKIVYKDTFADAEGNALKDMPEILVKMKFLELEGKTKVLTRSRFPSNKTLQLLIDTGVVQGFSSQFDRLDHLLEGL